MTFFVIGTRLFSFSCGVVEIIGYRRGEGLGQECGADESPDAYIYRAREGVFYEGFGGCQRSNGQLRPLVSPAQAEAMLDYLRGPESPSMAELASEGLVSLKPARGYLYDVLGALDPMQGVKVLRGYYGLSQEDFWRGPRAWMASFERVVLGEVAEVLGRPYDELRSELHALHPTMAAEDAAAAARIEARKNAKPRKLAKKPLPLP